MQITLTQEEVQEILETAVRNQISLRENQKIDIDFTMGRGGNGLMTTLDIKPIGAIAQPKGQTYRGEPSLVMPTTLRAAAPHEVEATVPVYDSAPDAPDVEEVAAAPEEVEEQEEPEAASKPVARPSIFAKAL